jgi:hypothetical protein
MLLQGRWPSITRRHSSRVQHTGLATWSMGYTAIAEHCNSTSRIRCMAANVRSTCYSCICHATCSVFKKTVSMTVIDQMCHNLTSFQHVLCSVVCCFGSRKITERISNLQLSKTMLSCRSGTSYMYTTQKTVNPVSRRRLSRAQSHRSAALAAGNSMHSKHAYAKRHPSPPKCMPRFSALDIIFGCYTSGTSPVWGANDRLIGQRLLVFKRKTRPSALPDLILQIIIK